MSFVPIFFVKEELGFFNFSQRDKKSANMFQMTNIQQETGCSLNLPHVSWDRLQSLPRNPVWRLSGREWTDDKYLVNAPWLTVP